VTFLHAALMVLYIEWDDLMATIAKGLANMA